MNKLKFTCLFIVLFSLSTNVIAQQETAFEKKKGELIAQIWTKWGFRTASRVSYLTDMSDEEVFKRAEAAELSVALVGESSMTSAIIWYAQELDKAQKLKKAIDFQRDKERILLKQQIEYEKTDVGNIGKSIKTDFEKWNQKGEFEKEIDYKERLKTQSKTAFDSVCVKTIKERISSLGSLNNELSNYDSEKECFIVTFKINNLKWESKIEIPINKAEEFKSNSYRLNYVVNDYDWCFIQNSLCPTLVTLEYQDQNFTLPLSLNDQIKITYSFDNICVDNENLKEYVISYSNAKKEAEDAQRKKEIERQRLDSLELVTYNNKLNSIFNDYNRQLLQDAYNIDMKTLPDYDRITGKDNRERNFKRSESSMTTNFDRLKNEFKGKYENEYKVNGYLFASKNEFDSIYSKGGNVLSEDITNRKFKLFSASITDLDLKKAFADYDRTLAGTFGEPTIELLLKEPKNAYFTHRVVRIIKNYEGKKQDYAKLIDVCVDTNVKINKLWNKDGKYFEDKLEFFNAYLSDNYKKQVTNNKKK